MFNECSSFNWQTFKSQRRGQSEVVSLKFQDSTGVFPKSVVLLLGMMAAAVTLGDMDI